jgi:hypothetical protein
MPFSREGEIFADFPFFSSANEDGLEFVLVIPAIRELDNRESPSGQTLKSDP